MSCDEIKSLPIIYNNKLVLKIQVLSEMEAPPINQDQLETVLSWVDQYALSKPKKNLARDFSDGILLAEILKDYFPQWIQLHNYTTANSASSKYINWKTLNEKVFKKLNFVICKSDIESVISVIPGTIQRVLYFIYTRLSSYENDKRMKKSYDGQIPDILEKQINPAILYAKQLSTQLVQKDDVIKELRDTVLILQQKMKKMEQLSKLKDTKIQSLMRKIEEGFL